MDTDLDTLATAFYVAADDLLKTHPERLPARPRIGISPRITDAKVITLAVMQALLGFASEARRLRHARKDLAMMFPYLPGQAGYNKRLRRLFPTMNWLIGVLTERHRLGRGLGGRLDPGRMRPDRATADERQTFLDILAGTRRWPGSVPTGTARSSGVPESAAPGTPCP